MLFGKKETATLSVEEMHCNHCTKRVEDTLSKMNGVKKVKANLENKTCEVVFDPDKQTVGNMCNALNEIGFPSEMKK